MPIVVLKHTTESLSACYQSFGDAHFLTWIDQTITNSLMVPFSMVMFNILVDGESKMFLAKEDHSVETLIFDRSDKSLCVCIQIRALPLIQMVLG